MSTPEGTSAVAPTPAGTTTGTALLESPHREVNHQPVEAVGERLHEGLGRYAHVVGSMRRGSEATKRDEIEWYANKGLVGDFIDLFNDARATDPARWDAVLDLWTRAETELTAAAAVPATPDRINDLGQHGQSALNTFQQAAERDRVEREAYSAYLTGFTGAAQGVHTTAVVVRDVSFAAAVGLAVVVAAPAVAAGVTAFGTGTLGLTAGSAGLTAFTYGGTALAMGGLGAAMEGTGQAVATLGAQASMALADFIRGRNTAVDNVDWSVVAEQGVEGLKRGFVDGVLAFAGGEAEKLIASHASAAIRSFFGPGNSTLYAMMLRRAVTRAVSGGVTGSVVGALSAGYRAAAEGQDLAGIWAAMEHGAALGGAAGVVLGGAGGAWEARGAHRLQTEVAAVLRERVEAGLAGTAADDALLDSVLAQMRANPTAGSNERLLELTPLVRRALRDPDNVSAAVAEVWLEEHLLGVMAPRAASDRYGEAARVLARRRGAQTIILPRTASFDEGQFFSQVVVSGNRFLDYSALALGQGEHGAITHAVQDLAADRVLAGTGVRAEQFRALLGQAVGRDGQVVGDMIWQSLFDSFNGGINQPEVLYPAMRQVLPALP